MIARVAAAILLAAMPAVARGQSCWVVKPNCRTFWITESGPRVGNHEAFVNRHVGSATAVGLMVNRSPRWAWGGAIELSTGSESGLYRLALVPRYRHWLGPQVALDIGAGIAVLGENEPAAGFKGVTGLAAIGYEPWVALTAQVETRNDFSDGTHTAGSIGVRFGGWVGPLVALGSLVWGFFASAGSN